MNRNIKILLLFLMLAASPALFAQDATPTWNGIVLLQSTKNDVETILGKPRNPRLNIYETRSELVTVWYSVGSCDRGDVWQLPAYTVVGLLISPKQFVDGKRTLEELRGRFIGERSYEMPNITTYHNDDFSIKVQLENKSTGQDAVVFIAYAPGNAGEKCRCRAAK